MQQVVEIEERTRGWAAEASAMTVRTPDAYRRAADLLLAVKDLRKQLNEAYDDNIADAHRAHKNLVAKKASFEAPLVAAERTLKARMLDYQQEQERVRREQERKLREEARKIEEEARIKEATRLEAEGRQKEAERLIDAPIFTPPVTVAPPTPKVQGVSYRETWSAEVVNMRALCRAVADGSVPTEYVTANMTALNARARADKAGFAVAGCRSIVNKQIAAGGR